MAFGAPGGLAMNRGGRDSEAAEGFGRAGADPARRRSNESHEDHWATLGGAGHRGPGGRGVGGHRFWLPWISANHLYGITGLEEYDPALFKKLSAKPEPP